MTLDPTRAYVTEIRSESRGSTGTHNGPSGHWRLVSVQVLPQPAQRNNDDVDVLYVWEPVLLDEQQALAWTRANDPADDIIRLGLDARTRSTLQAAGATSIKYLKSLTDDEFKRLRLSGPLSFRDLKDALGR